MHIKKSKSNSHLLQRYWFKTKENYGFGVSAYSLEDAEYLLHKALGSLTMKYEVIDVIENVDVRKLDQNHVIPNMGAPNFRGVWFPNLSL